MTPQTDKERIETLLTALDHCLDILQHKRLGRKELADYRQIKSYAKALRASLAESEAAE